MPSACFCWKNLIKLVLQLLNNHAHTHANIQKNTKCFTVVLLSMKISNFAKNTWIVFSSHHWKNLWGVFSVKDLLFSHTIVLYFVSNKHLCFLKIYICLNWSYAVNLSYAMIFGVFHIIAPHENVAPIMVCFPWLGVGAIGYLTSKLGGGLYWERPDFCLTSSKPTNKDESQFLQMSGPKISSQTKWR